MADVTIGKLKVEADTKGIDEMKEKLGELKEGFPTVGQAVDKFIETLRNIPGPAGAAAVAFVSFAAGLGELVEKTVQAQVKLLEMAEAVGVPMEKFQTFAAAMDMSGVSGEKLEKAMGKLASAVGSSLENPAGKAADAFKKLGISQEELKNGDTEQILKDTAAAFDQYADSAEKTAAIREVLGKQGPQIIAAMKDEAEYEKRVSEVMDDYGTKVTEADAKSAKYFESTLKLGMSMFAGVANTITKDLLPGLTELADQFVESGKQGGFMRDILDGVSATISFLAKVIITTLVEPVRFTIEIFKELGTIIGGVTAAIAQSMHGNFSDASKTIESMNQDLTKMQQDYVTNATKFETALWSGTKAVKEHGEAADETKKKYEAFQPAQQKVADTLEQLITAFVSQTTAENAASEGLQQYKAVQDEVAIGAMKLKLEKEGASKADIEAAEAAMRATNASKVRTEQELAGWNLINSLQQKNIELTTHQTELSKTLADIAKNPGMTQAEANEAVELAKKNDLLKQEIETKKQVAAMDQLVSQNIDKEVAGMKMTNDQLKVYNQEMALRKVYEADIKKEGADVDALTAAYNRNLQAIKENNKAVQDYQHSSQGFTDGFSKGLQQNLDDLTNMNKQGMAVSQKLTDEMTTAIMKFGTEGSKAFKDLAVAMLSYFEQLIVKALVTEGLILAMEALGVPGPIAGAILAGPSLGSVSGHANGSAFSGGGVTAFADGGIVGGPTLAPMALMGEAGPEAVMPLQRNSQGKLGIIAQGGAQASNVHYNTYSIAIHSNQDPKEIAKQVNIQTAKATQFVKTTIAKEQRPMGNLNSMNSAFNGWGG